jgi:predicted  nucleic acid-binding Zn-ribbon protein
MRPGTGMIQDNLLDLLENRIYQALKKISDQQKQIDTLIHEKKELEHTLSFKNEKITQLERELTEAESSVDAQAIAEYQEREAKLKNRLEELLDKIDKVRLLE